MLTLGGILRTFQQFPKNGIFIVISITSSNAASHFQRFRFVNLEKQKHKCGVANNIDLWKIWNLPNCDRRVYLACPLLKCNDYGLGRKVTLEAENV